MISSQAITTSSLSARYAALTAKQAQSGSVDIEGWINLAHDAMYLNKQLVALNASSEVVNGAMPLVSYQSEITPKMIASANALSEMQQTDGLSFGQFECKRFGNPIKAKSTGFKGIRVLVTKSAAPSVPAGTCLRLFDNALLHRGSLRWTPKSVSLTVQLESGLKTPITNNKALYRNQHFILIKEVMGGELPRKTISRLLGELELSKGASV